MVETAPPRPTTTPTLDRRSMLKAALGAAPVHTVIGGSGPPLLLVHGLRAVNLRAVNPCALNLWASNLRAILAP
jgi:hypothetical protein